MDPVQITFWTDTRGECVHWVGQWLCGGLPRDRIASDSKRDATSCAKSNGCRQFNFQAKDIPHSFAGVSEDLDLAYHWNASYGQCVHALCGISVLEVQ